MARSRMIKPEFWNDEKLATISMAARLVFVGIWNHSDDYGSVKGSAAWLKAMILPYDSVSMQDFEGWLTELQVLGRIIPYESTGEKFFYIRNFTRHQTINRPSKQRNPEPPKAILSEQAVSPPVQVIDETESETETETEDNSKTQSPNIRWKLQDGTFHEITQVQIMAFTKRYPEIDVKLSLTDGARWSEGQPPGKLKTDYNVGSQISNWLKNDVDKAREKKASESTYGRPEPPVI